MIDSLLFSQMIGCGIIYLQKTYVFISITQYFCTQQAKNPFIIKFGRMA